MRLNPFKNIRLSFQLFTLVVMSFAIASGLIYYAMQQVRSTQDTLKHTIDNRMVSGQSIQGVADALAMALEDSLKVIEKSQTPQEAHDQIKAAVSKAHDDWDNYFLGEMIPDEQALADETTPLLDKAYNTIDKLLKKLEAGDVATLAAWRNDTLRPALADGSSNLKKLIGMQLKAANQDLGKAKANYQLALRNSIYLLAAGALLAVVFAWIIIRGAMRKLGADPSQAAEVARRIADGDLQFEMEEGRNDDVSLMGALRQMKGNLLHSKLDYEGQINAIARVQGVVECTPSGVIINANDIFLKLLGYSPGEVKDKNYSMFVDADVRATDSYRGFWPALERGASKQGEYRKVTRDGRAVWVQGVYNPILGADGKPFKVVAYLSDVTKQREEALLNAAFRGALDQLDANVMVVDTDLRIIFVNPAATQMMERAQEAFRRDLPGFDAKLLLGASLKSLTREPSALRAQVERITDPVSRQ